MTTIPHPRQAVAIIGGGPAGLAAAEVISAAGVMVSIYEAMPSVGRKFLMAGKSGLNITHAEAMPDFLARYSEGGARLAPLIEAMDGQAITAWMEGLGIASHTGPTGRVFPEMMKASPLLRAWLARLQGQGVRIHTRHRFVGWTKWWSPDFMTPEGRRSYNPTAVLLAMGGGSWGRLGSDGRWMEPLEKAGIEVAPFRPSNCGFLVDWSDFMRDNWAGAPLKTIAMRHGDHTARGECVITERGLESGGIYALSAPLRETLMAQSEAVLEIDLLPDLSLETLEKRLSAPRGKQSMANVLRKSAGLSGVKSALLNEVTDRNLPADGRALAALIKAVPIKLTGTAPLDEAISTAGGVSWCALDDRLMLKSMPGTFCAGEMIDWDAPTGGYLITACLATGRAAGQGILDYLKTQP